METFCFHICIKLRSPKFYKVSPKLVKGITAAWNEEWKNSRAKKTTTDFN